MSKSWVAVANSVRLLRLPDEIKSSLAQRQITEGHAKAILALDQPDEQRKIWEEMLKRGLNMRQTEEAIRRRAEAQTPGPVIFTRDQGVGGSVSGGSGHQGAALSFQARAGLTEFTIPRQLRNTLFDFQTAAVKIAARHLNQRGGVLIGDVVGLGKTSAVPAPAATGRAGRRGRIGLPGRPGCARRSSGRQTAFAAKRLGYSSRAPCHIGARRPWAASSL